jgi:hypothetical protein
MRSVAMQADAWRGWTAPGFMPKAVPENKNNHASEIKAAVASEN